MTHGRQTGAYCDEPPENRKEKTGQKQQKELSSVELTLDKSSSFKSIFTSMSQSKRPNANQNMLCFPQKLRRGKHAPHQAALQVLSGRAPSALPRFPSNVSAPEIMLPHVTVSRGKTLAKQKNIACSFFY
jgi:hypothetical protein